MKPQHEIGGGVENEGLTTESGNQVMKCADIIRERFAERALYLGDAFPKNHQYQIGDYNNVFVSIEENLDARPWRYMVLNPDGKIYTGKVASKVNSFSTKLRFEDARLDEASDFEIIKWGPLLEIALRQQLLKEIDKEEDPVKIGNMLNIARVTHKDTMVSISSEMALAHMRGVKYLSPSERRSFYEYEATGLEAEIETINLKLSALKMFARKDKILQAIKEDVEQNMQASKLEADFKMVTRELIRDGIFPYDEVKLERKKNWHLGPPSDHAPFGSRHWAISAEGRAIEVSAHSSPKKIEYCAEHMLLQATEIASELIESAVKKNLPAIDLSRPFNYRILEAE